MGYIHILLIISFTVKKCLNLSSRDVFSDYARIRVEGGALILESAQNRNISFRTLGSGIVNINGENLSTFISRSRETDGSNLSNNRLDERLQALEERLGGENSDLLERLNYLESRLTRVENRSSTDSRSRRPNRNTINRLNRLHGRLLRLENKLTEDACTSNPCRNGGSCIDTYTGFICQCPDNWEGSTCERDVNECARFAGTDLGCQNGATCQNLPGTYSCHCAPGFYGIHCREKTNSCSSGTAQELCGHGICVDSSGSSSFTCICDQGWTTDGVNPACNVDVNECTGPNPPCSKNPLVACINTPGSFVCGACPAGYSGSGFYCSDIDECRINNGGCSQSPFVPCINTPGSRRCGGCPPGYSGNGETCTYLGPCHLNNGGCHPLATCVAMSGIVRCFCAPGYSGSGIGPLGCQPGGQSQPGPLPPPPQGDQGGSVIISPCASSPCNNGATCIPSAAGYMCQCPPGFTGPRCSISIAPCDSNPCQNGATCTNLNQALLLGLKILELSQHTQAYQCECASGFSGTNCEEEVEACGGEYFADSGHIDFPPGEGTTYGHSIVCSYLIRIQFGKVVQLNFTELNIEGSEGRCYDSLTVYEGSDASGHRIGKYCGHQVPGVNGTVYSNTHQVYLVFRSDASVAHNGFKLSWNTTLPSCGGTIEGENHGTITSPGYPRNYPHNADCTWLIRVQPGKRIQFHFAALSIETHRTCGYDKLSITEGEAEHVLAEYCNTSLPAPVTSSGYQASVRFISDESNSDSGFLLTWSSVPGVPGCGGLLTQAKGEFRSPRHPDSYDENLMCEWIIRVPPEDRVVVEFEQFQLEHDAGCQYDYLEVHEADGSLVGRFCGNVPPHKYESRSNQLKVVFKSDYSISHSGFLAKYKTACGGEFTAPTGIISSPYHPASYPEHRECIYRISAPLNTAIQIEFRDFDIEGLSWSESCPFDYLEIRDGDTMNSTSLGRFCGDSSRTPDGLVSTYNHIWMKFVTDGTVHNRGFQINYTTVDISCGGILKDRAGIISSPANPENYPHGAHCRWIISGEAGMVIRLTWLTFMLEGGRNCAHDRVVVYDFPPTNTRSSSNTTIGTYCGTQAPPELTSTDNRMALEFISDADVSNAGFTASYVMMNSSTFCGGNYFTPSGHITSPGWPEQYGHGRDCTWVVSVPAGQQILLNITTFELEHHTNCRYDFLEIRNGGYDSSPLIGKYCGDRIPSTIPSFTNQIYIRFKSDGSRTAPGFELTWDSTSTGCGGRLNDAEGSIMSPNYPQTYHHMAECFWSIHVSKGSRIQVNLADVDLEDSSSCRYDYVEIFDGTSSAAKSLGRFCKGPPQNILSSLNSVYVKFRSDYSNSGRGFHLSYSTLCRNEVFGHHGVIESPNFPLPYPHQRNCSWVISAPRGNSLNLTFTNFRLEEPNLSGNCTYDHVTVSEAKEDLSSTKVLGKYCNTNIPSTISTTESKAVIDFISDHSVADNGFRLEWVVEGCGGRLLKPAGQFSTPNWPQTYGHELECIWRIETEPGSKIELNITELGIEHNADCLFDYLAVYGGEDETSPLLSKLCDRQVYNTVLTSFGNKMYIKFESDYSIASKGFTATYKTVAGGCGGYMRANKGIITSPNYPNNYDPHDDCGWLLEVDRNHVVRLTFEDFDVEPHRNCSYDHVAVYDGNSTNSPVLLVHCGQDMPVPDHVTSTSNQMYVRLKADGSVSSKGFKANFTRGCGARIVTEGQGVLTTPGFPLPMIQNENCSWIIQGARESDRVTVQVTYMELDQAENSDNCSDTRGYLDLVEGDDGDGPLLGRYCGRVAPPAVTSQGSNIFVHLVNPVGRIRHKQKFSATYTVEDTACGGTLTSEEGRIASPGYPNSYPMGVECVWRIDAPASSRVHLSFVQFSLEDSEDCNNDYVDVYEDGPDGVHLGRFCGTSPPTQLPAVQRYWLKFNSDGDQTGAGFIAEYHMQYGGELTGSSGTIESINYPALYSSNRDREVTWTITVEEDNIVEISFEVFELEKLDVCLNRLDVHDGETADGEVLFGGCGVDRPETVRTTSNVAHIVWSASYFYGGSRFKMNWRKVGRNRMFLLNSTTETVQCGGNIEVGPTEVHILKSPGYPNGYQDNLRCEWIIKTVRDTRIKLRIAQLRLESSMRCSYDKLTIYDGMYGTQTWNKTGTYCRRSQRTTIFSSGTYMKVVFTTDASRSRKGFMLYVQTAYGGYLTDRSGVLISPGFPVNYTRNLDCTWIIRMRPSTQMEFQFSDLELNSSSNECAEDYLILRNGDRSTSPFFLINPHQGDQQNGHICGSFLPEKQNTSSNLLYVRMVTDATGAGKGFKLHFNELSNGCGGQILLSLDQPEQELTSPNYPNVPHPKTECEWRVLSPSGTRIFMDVLNLDVKTSRRCSVAGLEVRDGGTGFSTEIGTYCMEPPHTLESSDSILYIRYYTNSNNPNNGFRAKVKIGKCGGTRYIGKQGMVTLSSPMYPEHYENNLECKWDIKGPDGHYLVFKISRLDLPSASNCSQTDNLSIQDVNATEPVLGTYCGSLRGQSPIRVDSTSNHATVIFKSDGLSQDKSGFLMKINASVDECGGILDELTGTLTSPGYPNGYPHHHICSWVIRAPHGRKVRLTFQDFDLEEPVFSSRYNSSICMYDSLQVFSGVHYPYRTAAFPLTQNGGAKRCGNQIPEPVSSSGSHMLIILKTDGSLNSRGFTATWDTDQLADCEDSPTATTGVISPPTVNGNYTDFLFCMWKLEPQVGTTTELRLPEYYIEDSPGDRCVYDIFTAFGGSIRADYHPLIKGVCGDKTEPTIAASADAIKMIFKTDYLHTDRGFNLTYTRHNCGGILEGPNNVITSPNYPRNYPNNVRCVWHLRYSRDTQIQINITNLGLEASCQNDNLTIYNGEHKTSPILWQGCGTSPPSSLVTMSNRATIDFASNSGSAGTGFRIIAAELTTGCGGILHGRAGNISAPRETGSTKYQNSAECVWEIRGDPGYQIKFDFVGRFDLEQSAGCANDYVKIEHWDPLNNRWVEASEKLCGRRTPADLTVPENLARIIFHSNRGVNGDGFLLHWRLDCGGLFTEAEGVLTSPGYPANYGARLNCTYIIAAPPQDYVVATFDDNFELEGRIGGTCSADSLSVFESPSIISKGVFCGTSGPQTLAARGRMVLRLKTDSTVQKSGFRVSWATHQCGGSITEEGEISSPVHPSNYFHNSNCTWTITAPANKAIEIKFNKLELERHRRCSYDYVAVYEGALINSTKLIGKYCGNQTQVPPILKSRGNTMILQFKTDRTVNAGGFKAVVKFTYGANQGCGGIVNVTTGRGEVSSVDADRSGQYQPDLNCQWSVIGADYKIIKMRFTSFDLEIRDNGTHSQCWDYVEVRDGSGPYSPLIGRYCGSNAPADITSSSNLLWIKFFSDSTNNRPGFHAVLTSENPLCGTHTVLNATEDTQLITSPNFGAQYPVNVRCVWTITSPDRTPIQVKVLIMYIEDSPRCTKDKLVIEDSDYGQRYQINQDPGEALIVSSPSNYGFTDYRFRMSMKHKGEYCGSQLPHIFTSTTDTIKISFISDGSITASGFKLEYKAMSCSRTYEEPYGRIFSPHWPRRSTGNQNCTSVIRAPNAGFVSLYFSYFGISSSTNCSDAYLEVRDGGDATSPLLAKLCGYALPETIHSSGSELWLNYVSNSTRKRTKFDISYTTSQDRGCGGTLYDTRGKVTSPNFPRSYNQTSDCYWTLKVPPGQQLELKFLRFLIGANREVCGENYLEIIDGEVNRDSNTGLNTRFCGTTSPAVHQADSNIVTLHYVTSANNTGPGWSAVFQIRQESSLSGSSPVGGYTPHN